MDDSSSIETETEKETREKARAYLDALPEYPNFALPNDKIDGLIPTAKIKSWLDLFQILQEPEFKKTKNDMIFRGHRIHHWQLASTLGRRFKGGAIPNEKSNALMEQFQLAMRGRGYDLGPLEEDEDIWAVGQHYGLNTPLLDWTRSPFVALFFAFTKYEDSETTALNPSRAIFCLNMTRIKEDLGTEVENLFFEPKDHRNSRLVNQSGLFSIAPGGDDNLVSFLVNALDEKDFIAASADVDVTESEIDPSASSEDFLEAANSFLFGVSDAQRAKDLSKYVFKLHIPNTIEDRKACLETLRQMNIHNGNLFPDPGGASQFCNDWLARLLEDEIVELAADAEAEEQKQVAEAITTASAPDVLGHIESLLNAYGEHSNLDLASVPMLSSEIKKAADTAMTIDWHVSDSKKGRVRLSIRKVLQGHGFGDLSLVEGKTLVGDVLEVFVKHAGVQNG